MLGRSFRQFLAIALGAGALAGLAPATAQAQDAATGRTLFQNFCTACHGFPPSGGPERAANDPSVIAAAINGRVPAMAFLRGVVTSQNMVDIAAFLGSIFSAPPPPPPAPPTPAHDYTDLWWNEAESGWGLNLIQHPSHQVFGVVYTYDTTRKPMWLVIPGGTWTAAAIFTGVIYRVTGPPPTVPFSPSLVRVRQVGVATLSFSSRDAGTFTYTMDGVTVTKPITRQPF